MPRKRRASRATGSDADRLIQLARQLNDSGSRTEDRYWENLLAQHIDQLLHQSDEDTLNEALDSTHQNAPAVFETLLDAIESRVECGCDRLDGHDVLLVSIPVLAWSRYAIGSGPIDDDILQDIAVQFGAHVLARDARFTLINFLFSPDQMPEGFCATAALTSEGGVAASERKMLTVDPALLPETATFLTDIRYLIGVVVVTAGEPMFRWQETPLPRDEVEIPWREQVGPSIARLLPGCAFQVLLPNAYFGANRQSDRASRDYSVRASITFLCTVLETEPSRLRAVIGRFSDGSATELRIGFTAERAAQVLHGVVWPLFGDDDDPLEAADTVTALLRDCGLTEIIRHDHRFPLEYCDDCGAPLFPSPEGDVVHAELPEEQAEQMPRHLN